MPDNKFSSSVDEILETLKQQQAAAPASDRAVDEILADLGLGDGLPLPPVKETPAPQPAPKARPAAAPAEEKTPRPAPQPEAGQARPAAAEQPAKAPAPAQKQAAKQTPPAKAQAPQKQEAPRQSAPEQPARRTLQRPAAKAPAAEPERETDEVIRQVQQTVSAPAAPSPDALQQLTGTISETMQFDAEFQKFFSESVAVIPDEEPEQHPGFFARFLRHKDDDAGFEEDDERTETGEVRGDEPAPMSPSRRRSRWPCR